MKINQELNWQLEAIDYIQQRYSGTDYLKGMKVKLIERGVAIDKIETLLGKHESFIRAIEREVSVPEELIPYFLMDFHEGRPFLIIFYIEYLAYKDMDYHRFLQFFLKQYLFDGRIIPDDLPSVLKLINELKADDKNKLSLINFYLGGEALYQKIIFEIDKVAQIIKDKYPIISDDIHATYQTLLDEENLNNYLSEYLRLDNILKGDEVVTIQAVSCNILSLSLVNDKMNIYVGYLGMKMHEIKNDISLNETKLITILKTLADPTRFKILQILKSGNTYGNDLAKRVELTPATVNHHLNLLLNERIIKAEFSEDDDKKVFYRLQNQIIEQFIEDLRRVLL